VPAIRRAPSQCGQLPPVARGTAQEPGRSLTIKELVCQLVSPQPSSISAKKPCHCPLVCTVPIPHVETFGWRRSPVGEVGSSASVEQLGPRHAGLQIHTPPVVHLPFSLQSRSPEQPVVIEPPSAATEVLLLPAQPSTASWASVCSILGPSPPGVPRLLPASACRRARLYTMVPRARAGRARDIDRIRGRVRIRLYVLYARAGISYAGVAALLPASRRPRRERERVCVCVSGWGEEQPSSTPANSNPTSRRTTLGDDRQRCTRGCIPPSRARGLRYDRASAELQYQ
jgi:hypothetical protein